MSEWKPYKFQKEVASLLLSGKSVILQAPTGAGKTSAALLPFLHAWREETDEHFPIKCVYTVPMRVLANQFKAEYQERANSFGRRFKRNLNVRIQTGEHSEDREFEGDLIFCTIDQFLSSYLTMPYGLPRRLANINAGAFVGSYLVFDEFHLLDPDSTLPSTLYAVKRLSCIAPVLLMTATFSKSVLNALKDELYNAEVVLVDPEEASSIETSFGEKEARQRIWQVAETQLSTSVVLEKHNKRSLAICNTVRKAQELYRELRDSDLAKERGVEILLFHSRFLQEDRQEIEQRIKILFGRDNQEGSVIAIATQTIEVGVDITSEILHTELAPASALIQRAGRCARYAGEQGQVIVYPVEKKSPYLSKSWENEMNESLIWLNDHNNEIFDFGKEQDFINAVATPRDEQILVKISAGRASRDQSINRALIGEVDSQATRDLVRDADSKLVLIHSDPKNQLTLNPYLAKGFNIQTKTLFGMVKEWRERDVDIDWRVMRLIEDKQDKEESNRTDYDWQPLTDEKALITTRIIAINPELAGYLKDEGFVSDRGNTDFVSTMPEISELKKAYEGFSYKKESYEDHIKRVLEAFQDVSLKELPYSAKALEQAAGWSEGSVMRAVWLACLFHDVGKLSEDWQGWARAYQKEIGMSVSREFSAGHTEYDRKNPAHEKAEKAVRTHHKKPNHAGESALASVKIISKAFSLPIEEGLVKAILTAITRHHTPFANECKTYVLEEQAANHIYATLDFVPEEIRQRVNLELLRSESKTIQNSFSNLLIAPDDKFGWMAYALLARALRRSDQEGTAQGSR
jgi:CRISPR-associated endonuclease/helicase Cas3